MSTAVLSIFVGIGIFLIGQAFIAIFWAGRHSERSETHGKKIDAIEENAKESRAALREEVKSALESWQEGRGEKIAELSGDVEKLTSRIDRGFEELRNLVTAVSGEMTNQHHRLRAVERAAGVQPSEPRMAAIPHPHTDPRRER